jgi:hypothetical protein
MGYRIHRYRYNRIRLCVCVLVTNPKRLLTPELTQDDKAERLTARSSMDMLLSV